MTQPLLIPMMMRMRWTIDQPLARGEADWWFFGETTTWIKISLNYIMGLN